MIDSYFVRKVNGEEVLYINFDFSYEFSSFDFMAKREKIEEFVRNFIHDNKIAFRGATVLLVSGGVLFGSIFLNTPNYSGSSIDSTSPVISVSNDCFVLDNSVIDNSSVVMDSSDDVDSESNEVIQNESADVNDIITPKIEQKSQIKEVNVSKVEQKIQDREVNVPKVEDNIQVSKVTTNIGESQVKEVVTPNVEESQVNEAVNNNIYISVNRGGNVINIELEEYVIGVVGAEMPASFNSEALKAQSVIARTYALKANSKGKVLSDNESSQSYKSKEQLKSLWGSSYDTYFNKVSDAVYSTRGMYLTYNGIYIEAVYHSTSNGRTEDSSNVWGNSFPYLVSVDSPYDSGNPSFIKSISFSYSEISKKLDVIVTSDTVFSINSRTIGDRVANISVGNVNFSGVQFRNMLGLRSADFDIEKNDDGVVITTRGYGHGVGLSQYGANGMAKAGSSYRDILFHYYPGVSLKSL